MKFYILNAFYFYIYIYATHNRLWRDKEGYSQLERKNKTVRWDFISPL